MPKRIVLRVREEIGCPLFRSGDQMVLEHPGVDRAASSNLCTLTIARYLALQGDASCEHAGPAAGLRELYCPRTTAPVVFDVFEETDPSTWRPLVGALGQDITQAVAALRTMPIFRSLPTPALQRLAGEMKVERHAAGATIVERGAVGRAYYLVHEGELEVVGYADTEVSSVLTRLCAKDGFGEMSLLTGAPTVASVVAITDVTLLVLPKESFERLLRESPYMASSFTRLLASRLMATNSLLVKEGSKPFSGKLQEMGLPTVLQVLAESSRSGTLVVDDYHGKKGTIGLSHGRPFRAAVGALTGADAVYAMLAWDKGDFWLDKKDVPDADEIQTSVMGLLLEGMRRIDESAALGDDLPSFE
ncbi:cyclic nucleotide-binding domain-containing protein [Myxococcota bacterium]|nr:cyclic nucleotide-binding domain-containing protein [Myxococcota bacterium]